MRVVLCLMFMMFGQLYAQTSFFVKPMLNNKIDFGSSSPRRFDNYAFNSNPLFHYDNKTVITTGLNSIDLGIGLGAIFRKKHLIELDFNTDATGSGNEIYFEYKNIDGSYYQTSRKNIYGKAINRLSIQYSYLAASKFHYTIGMSFGFKQPSAIGRLDAELYKTEEIADNVFFTQEIWGIGINRFNFYLTAGVGRDFYCKKLYLFSFDILFNKGFSLISGAGTEIIIVDNGIVKRHNFMSYSKGTGLYFQLSRRFQLYPWIKIKKKEGREIEKF